MTTSLVSSALHLLSHGEWCRPRNWEEAADFNLLVRKNYAIQRYDSWPDVPGSEIPDRKYPWYKITTAGFDKYEELKRE